MLTETQTTTRVVSLDLRLSLRVATAEGRVRDASGTLVAHGTETWVIVKQEV